MSDNEYERFEITDYDLDNEFNPNRPRRRQTKNQQIYGIWAEDSDAESGDEVLDRKGRRRRGGMGSSGSRQSKDYTAPVSFVAGGIHQAGKKTKKVKEGELNEENDKNLITDEEDEEDAHPGFGRKRPELMGLGSPHSSDSDSSAEEETKQKPAPTRPQQYSSSGSMTKGLGIWEQHTRGIGAKLLLQMGYKPGKGLGKDLQGISQPVEAHVRKGRGAIGAYGPETKIKKNQLPVMEEEVRESKAFKEKTNKWKKDDKTKRYYYESVEEILERGKKSGTHLSDKLSKRLGNVPVIDMTGPEKRVLSGYHALGQARIIDEDLYDLEAGKKSISSSATATTTTSTPATHFALPELMHNLQLLVNMSEQEIINLDKDEREASDRQVAIERDLKNREEIVRLEKEHIDSLESTLELVDELTSGSETLSLQRAEQIFLEIQQKYPAEYQEFGLSDLAAGVIAPLVKAKLQDWSPLESPTQPVDLIKKWRGILTQRDDDKPETRNVFDPYSSLIWAGVIPSFRASAASWNPKQHQVMAALLDCWAPLFPTWILDTVLEQMVLQRLSAGVREWNPLTDTVPIHIWILPWNSILGHKMEEFIFPTIREKLSNALQGWTAQDRSARAMLTPWKGVFDSGEMQMFLMQHIIPKLEVVLNDFVINPLQQDLEPWNQVWEWHEIIPPIQMGQLLSKNFFPKWMQVLVLWLNQSPDYTEISRWYNGWKSMLSEEVLREPSIKEYLRRALEIMHRATENVSVPMTGAAPTVIPPTMGVPPMGMTASGGPVPLSQSPMIFDLQMSAPAQLEFKELVSQKCSERGIIFAPMPGRRELGKQIYRVGKLFCYIDRNVCMLSDGAMQNWNPTALSQLLDRAVTGII